MTKQTVAILSVISGNVKFASDRYLQEQNLYRYENGVRCYKFFHFIKFSGPATPYCWFNEKIFFIDLDSETKDYWSAAKLLKHHDSQIRNFLSKCVTHVIRLEEPNSSRKPTNLRVIKMRHTRASRLINLFFGKI